MIKYDMGKGTPLILLHGFPLNHQNWKFQFTTLSKRCRVIALDLVPRKTMSEMAEDIHQVMVENSIGRAIFSGFSMGGYVLFEYLKRYPATALGASFICARMVADSPEARENRNSLIERLKAGDLPNYVEEYLALIFSEAYLKNASNDVDQVRQIILQRSIADIIDWTKAIRDREVSTESLKSLKIPTAVLGAREDKVIPLSDLLDLHDSLLDSSIEIVDKVGHMLPHEAPDRVNSHILNLVKRVEFKP